MPLRFVFHSLTHKGMVRPDNQDNVYAGKLSRTAERYLFAVADGVGGREGGAWASQRALQALVQEMSQPGISMTTAIQTANQAVFQEAARNTARNGAATTLTAVLVENDTFTWANVGDSRAYLMRDEKCYQLTRDHSLVEEDLAAGRITREEAETSNYRNVITRSIGNRPGVEVDSEGPFEMDPGDVLLLCSDGLHQLVNIDEMTKQLLEGTAESAAAALVDLANERGGPDNISVVICASGVGTESRFRRGGKPGTTTQATRFIPRENFTMAAAAPVPMPDAFSDEEEVVADELEDEPMAAAALQEEPEARAAPEAGKASPALEQPDELDDILVAALQEESVREEPGLPPPAQDADERDTRARPILRSPARQPEPEIEAPPATPRRVAQLEPAPMEQEQPPEPARTPSREPVAAAAAPARQTAEPAAPRARQQENDAEPRQSDGPGIRLIGFGIAVGATVGILIGLLRPF